MTSRAGASSSRRDGLSADTQPRAAACSSPADESVSLEALEPHLQAFQQWQVARCQQQHLTLHPIQAAAGILMLFLVIQDAQPVGWPRTAIVALAPLLAAIVLHVALLSSTTWARHPGTCMLASELAYFLSTLPVTLRHVLNPARPNRWHSKVLTGTGIINLWLSAWVYPRHQAVDAYITLLMMAVTAILLVGPACSAMTADPLSHQSLQQLQLQAYRLLHPLLGPPEQPPPPLCCGALMLWLQLVCGFLLVALRSLVHQREWLVYADQAGILPLVLATGSSLWRSAGGVMLVAWAMGVCACAAVGWLALHAAC